MDPKSYEAAPMLEDWQKPVEKPRSAHKLTRFLGVAALGVLPAHIGGVTATHMYPAHIQTANYAADVSLSYTRFDTVEASSILGGVHLTFNSKVPSPAVTVEPTLRPEIVDSYVRGGADELVVSEEQMRASLEQVALQLGERYATGAALAMLLTMGAYSAVARHKSREAAIALVASMGLAISYQGVSAATTYTRPYQKIELDGLAGSLLKQGELVLDGVNKRSQQIQPYFASWLELQTALAKVATPMEKEQSSEGSSFLLVSDIHGVNMYSSLEQVIKEEGITAVIDSGDLLNMGRVQEAELAGIFDNIAKLGVPYIIVLGNHDRSSPDDTALIDRLMAIPNVVVLQPGRDRFQVAHFGDLKIAGVNDFMRWYGDDNKDNAVKQKPVWELFNRTFAGQEIDLGISHEPAAAEKLQAAITNSGHLHKDQVNGTHIVTGTFTGGGIFGYGDATPPDAQSSEQSYGILRFDGQCQATRLDTLRFHGAFEGKPTRDSMTFTFFDKKKPEADATKTRDCTNQEFSVVTATTPRDVAR